MVNNTSANTKRIRNKTKYGIVDYIAIHRWLVPIMLIAGYVIVYSILFPKVFLTLPNISYVLLEFSIPCFVIIGMAIQLINGEIDLSVGYAVMFSNLMVSLLIITGTPVALAIIATIACVVCVGFIVGILVSILGVNSFIATIGTGMAFYGVGLIIHDIGFIIGSKNTTGVDMSHLPDAFKSISQTSIMGIQLPVIYAVVAIVIFVFLMSKSPYFRKYYFIGMNKEAAKLSGINVRTMKIVAFILSGGLASFAGVLMAARMGSSGSTFGIGMELDAITAVVIGGVSFKGGRGTMGGAILGGLFIFCLSNALRIANTPSNIYKVIEGLVLLAAVILDAQFSKRKVIG